MESVPVAQFTGGTRQRTLRLPQLSVLVYVFYSTNMEFPGSVLGRASTSGDPIPLEKSSDDGETQWPLSFKLQDPQEISGGWFGQQAPKRWWSHNLYRGPGKQQVEILYSKTKASSELIAKRFLKEPILGFDMV